MEPFICWLKSNSCPRLLCGVESSYFKTIIFHLLGTINNVSLAMVQPSLMKEPPHIWNGPHLYVWLKAAFVQNQMGLGHCRRGIAVHVLL